MKISTALALIAFTIAVATFRTDPQYTSWFTTVAGRYARISLTDADKTSGNAVMAWSRNSPSQDSPAYSGGMKRYARLDPNLAKHSADGLRLSEADQRALLALLKTLTDGEFSLATTAREASKTIAFAAGTP